MFLLKNPSKFHQAFSTENEQEIFTRKIITTHQFEKTNLFPFILGFTDTKQNFLV